MQPIFDFMNLVRQRVNARIAILLVVLAIGSVAVWQGFRHMAANKPKTPTKQVATGVQSAAAGVVQTVGAALPDDQLPGGAASGVQPLGSAYGQSAGSGASDINQVNPYATAAQPATIPPSASLYGPATGPNVPDNPYRTSVGDEPPPTTPPTSPYAQAAEQTTPESPGAAAPPEDPIAAFARKFGKTDRSTLAPVVSPQQARESAAAGGSSAESFSSPYTAEQPSPQTAPLVSSPADTPPTRLPTPSLGNSPSGFSPNAAGASRSSIGQPLIQDHSPAADGAVRAAATPGQRQLEGPQQPSITIEKFAPSEIQVGKAATLELVVRNSGQVPAQNVVVSDHVPAGTQLIDVKPPTSHAADGSLVWQLGTMQPGDDTTITIQVMPQEEGELGSTAQVAFAAQATSRSICTRPQLAIEHTAPPKVLIGESLSVAITVANQGTGAATGVMIEEDVPAGLSHVAGAELEYEIGTLRPNESKRLELSLKAEKPGLVENTIVVRGEGGLAASHKVQIEVVAPQLEVDVAGPKIRFLQRQATYTVSILNPGTASARDVELVAYLPRGMKFVEAESQGQYDPAEHAVFWSLEELPPTHGGSVKLTTLPVEPGEQRLRIQGKADLGLEVAGEQVVQVQEAAELLHSVKDVDEVIEVGSETTYLIKVSNVGTKAATGVRVVAILPPEIQGLAGEGPTGKPAGDASQIAFEPLPRLNPNEEVTFKVQAKGVAPGDHIVRVQLSSNEWQTPVAREESTRVYQDR
jgi:uncharacterized repeat protein (TIGR01451 family)